MVHWERSLFISWGWGEAFFFFFFFGGGCHELKFDPVGGQTIILSSVGVTNSNVRFFWWIGVIGGIFVKCRCF